MPVAQRIRLGGLAAVLGGVLWVVLRPLVGTTWDNPTFGLTYEDYNRLMVAPLSLLLAGTWGLWVRYAPSTGRAASAGLALLALGLVVSLAGVVIEFWWGRGLRGTRDLAMAGWGFYLVALLGQAIGLALFGIAALRARVRPPWLGTVSLLVAALHVVWLPSTALPGDAWSLLDQILIGLGWIALVYGVWRNRSARHTAHAQSGGLDGRPQETT